MTLPAGTKPAKKAKPHPTPSERMGSPVVTPFAPAPTPTAPSSGRTVLTNDTLLDVLAQRLDARRLVGNAQALGLTAPSRPAIMSASTLRAI